MGHFEKIKTLRFIRGVVDVYLKVWRPSRLGGKLENNHLQTRTYAYASLIIVRRFSYSVTLKGQKSNRFRAMYLKGRYS